MCSTFNFYLLKIKKQIPQIHHLKFQTNNCFLIERGLEGACSLLGINSFKSLTMQKCILLLRVPSTLSPLLRMHHITWRHLALLARESQLQSPQYGMCLCVCWGGGGEVVSDISTLTSIPKEFWRRWSKHSEIHCSRLRLYKKKLHFTNIQYINRYWHHCLVWKVQSYPEKKKIHNSQIWVWLSQKANSPSN